MDEHAPAQRSATSGTPPFDERLTVPWWWYLPALGLAVLLAAEVHMGYPGFRQWIGYVVLLPTAVLVLVWLGRVRVRVAGGVLTAGEHRLPLDRVGRVDVVTGRDEKQVALGPDLDPTAVLVHRAWVGPVVRIEVLGGDVPYWVVSAREPERLVRALAR